MSGHFEVYTDKRGQLRWRFKARNGQIIARASEGYTSRVALEQSLQFAQDGEGTVEWLEDPAGKHRWHCKATNGAILCTAAEWYRRRHDCEHGFRVFRKQASWANVQVLA